MSDDSDNESLGETNEVEDVLEKKNRNRERNKEHARKTRLRKKEQLDALKARIQDLEEERTVLKQQVEACNVASILIGLSSGEGDALSQNEVTSPAADSIASQPSFSEALSGGKRKRFLSIDGEDSAPPPMELNIKGHITLVGGSGKNGKTQVNWKTGVYFDEDGRKQQLTALELKALRRERNRMHAKMTRDRKKCFVASLNRVIAKLEEENRDLRRVLARSDNDTICDRKPDSYGNYVNDPLHLHESYNNVPLSLQESSVALMTTFNSSVVNDEVVNERKPEQSEEQAKSVPLNLQESSAALVSIANSRIFTVG